MKIKSITTKRLVLRPWRLTDFKRWCYSHEVALPKQNKFDRDPWPKHKLKYSTFKRSVLHHRRLAKKDLTYIWNIFLNDSGEFIGWIDIGTISRDPHQMANLGYFITNTYRGKGYAREAVRKIISVSFRDLKFHRLEAAIDTDNSASIQFARACGLYKEGIKKHYWYQNKRWEDQVVFIATPELFT